MFLDTTARTPPQPSFIRVTLPPLAASCFSMLRTEGFLDLRTHECGGLHEIFHSAPPEMSSVHSEDTWLFWHRSSLLPTSSLWRVPPTKSLYSQRLATRVASTRGHCGLPFAFGAVLCLLEREPSHLADVVSTCFGVKQCFLNL